MFDRDRNITSGAYFLLRPVHETGLCDAFMANSKSCDCCLVFPYFEVCCFFIRGFSDIVEIRGGFSRPYFVPFISKAFEYSFFVFVYRSVFCRCAGSFILEISWWGGIQISEISLPRCCIFSIFNWIFCIIGLVHNAFGSASRLDFESVRVAAWVSSVSSIIFNPCSIANRTLLRKLLVVSTAARVYSDVNAHHRNSLMIVPSVNIFLCSE